MTSARAARPWGSLPVLGCDRRKLGDCRPRRAARANALVHRRAGERRPHGVRTELLRLPSRRPPGGVRGAATVRLELSEPVGRQDGRRTARVSDGVDAADRSRQPGRRHDDQYRRVPAAGEWRAARGAGADATSRRHAPLGAWRAARSRRYRAAAARRRRPPDNEAAEAAMRPPPRRHSARGWRSPAGSRTSSRSPTRCCGSPIPAIG